MLQETCKGHSQKGESIETHRNWKQKTTGKPLSNKNNALCKAELSEPEKEIQTEPWNTKKQVTPDFLFKKEKKVGGAWNYSCSLDPVNSYPPVSTCPVSVMLWDRSIARILNNITEAIKYQEIQTLHF